MAFLTNENVARQFSTTLPNAAGQEEKLLERIEFYLEQADLPGVSWRMVKVSSSTLAAMAGYQERFLQVQNSRIGSLRVYLGASSYGAHLNFAEYLTIEPGILSQIISWFLYSEVHPKARFIGAIQDLNCSPFIIREVKAFTEVIHGLCIEPAIQEMTEILEKKHVTRWQGKDALNFW